MSNIIYSIYKITNKINNKIYIGFTSKTIEERFQEHVNSAIYHKDKIYFHNAIRKYGKESFLLEKIDESLDRNYALNVLEPKYIKEYKSNNKKYGYNLTNGGEGASFTEEIRKKLSENKKEKYRLGILKNNNKGKKYDEIFGEVRSKEIRYKIKKNHYNCNGSNNSFYGKKHKKETIKLIKEKMSGSNNKLSKCVVIYDDNYNILRLYVGINQLSKELGYKYPSSLKRCIKNKNKINTKHISKYQGYNICYLEDFIPQ